MSISRTEAQYQRCENCNCVLLECDGHIMLCRDCEAKADEGFDGDEIDPSGGYDPDDSDEPDDSEGYNFDFDGDDGRYDEGGES